MKIFILKDKNNSRHLETILGSLNTEYQFEIIYDIDRVEECDLLFIVPKPITDLSVSGRFKTTIGNLNSIILNKFLKSGVTYDNVLIFYEDNGNCLKLNQLYETGDDKYVLYCSFIANVIDISEYVKKKFKKVELGEKSYSSVMNPSFDLEYIKKLHENCSEPNEPKVSFIDMMKLEHSLDVSIRVDFNFEDDNIMLILGGKYV